MTQPEALRLAAELEACPTINYKAHAAELRRLHIDNEACGIHLSERMIDLAKVEAQRDALLEALKYHQEQTRPIQRTIDAIKASEENA